MYIFDLKLGYSCNNKCHHCVIQPNALELTNRNKNIDRSTKQCKKEIDDAIKEKEALVEDRATIVITGGEPTIRKDLLEICEYAVERGFDKVRMQTNGRALKNMDLVKSLLAIQPDMGFNVAIHGFNAEIHEKVSQVEGSFAETITGIENLMKAGSNLSIKLVISKINSDYLHETFEFITKFNSSRINIAFPHSSLQDSRFFEYVPRYRSIQPLLKSISGFAKDNNLPLMWEAVPFCFLEGYEEYVSELGFTFREANRYFSPVGVGYLDWNKRRSDIKAKAEQCDLCLLNSFCEGVWQEYIHHYQEEEFKPVTNVKRFFEITHKMEVIKQFHKVPA